MVNKPKTKVVSLRKKSEFNNVYNNGERFKCGSWILVSFVSNDLGFCRWGFTIPKYVGNAVLRNKFRRWGRELIRNKNIDFKSNFDINFVFMRKKEEFYKDVSFIEFEKHFVKSFKKLSQLR